MSRFQSPSEIQTAVLSGRRTGREPVEIRPKADVTTVA